MKLRVLKQFSHFRLGAFVAKETIDVPDQYASHLIEIGVAEEIESATTKETQPTNEAQSDGNKRTRSRKP